MSLIGKPTVEETQAPSGRESGSEWLERGDHPLLNNVILETLFGLVRRFDLKECRVVSKNWNTRTIPHMRATFNVTIHRNRFTETMTRVGGDPHNIDNFVKIFNTNKLGFPFEKFNLEPFRTTNRLGQRFLQLCGETTMEMNVNEVYEFYTIEDVSELLRQCPNLKVLYFPSRLVSRTGSVVKLFPNFTATFPFLKKITFTHPFERKPLDHCPSGTEELLTAVPNISDIVVFDMLDVIRDLENEAGDADTDASNISDVLNCIEKLGRESSIHSLELHYAKIHHIHQLRRMSEKPNGLKLKSLGLKLNNETETTEEDFMTMEIQLVTILKDTLQHLNMDLTAQKISKEFPFLPHLQSLAFIATEGSDPVPLDLTKNFPALQKLTIGFEDEWEECEWSDFFSQFQSCPTIKTLNVQTSRARASVQTFQDIQRVFPHLTKLSLNAGDDGAEILRQIWSHMTQLESLSFSISISIERGEDSNLDSVFTGIPTGRLRLIRRTGILENILDERTMEERRDLILNLVEQYSRSPSIRNLTKLRHLDLDVVVRLVPRRRFHLTDLTAFLAFYSMNRLRHLKVKRCMLMTSCCEILTKETGLESWSFQNDNDNHIIPPFLLPERENAYN